MARSTCAECGQAVRGRRLCQQCELDQCYGQELNDESPDEPIDTHICECSDEECSRTYTVRADERIECPDCGNDSHYRLETRKGEST